ncbi:MAG: 2-hydroxyacyl-CoA dehydratase, partial [Deltaproteobacteria bacterium]|nr:2-hydroxyacyl-CoA dehydratase [Deltaproteobacteria bacterium]
IGQLEQITRRRFSYQKFQEVIKLARESSATWGQILATMRHRPAPMTIFDAFVHMAPIVSLRGLPVTQDYYRMLLQELEERVAAGIGGLAHERKRLLWDNIAVWFKLREWSQLFAEKGYNFVAATYTNAWAETIEHLDAARPFESMARTYSLIILNNHLGHRLGLMKKMIEDYQIDGLVIHSTRSCKPYSLGQYDIKRLLMSQTERPAVIIDADLTDYRVYSEEQTQAKLEVFFETLEG